MIGYPLDSHVTFRDGIPEYDRAISSAPLRELIKRLFSDGVLPDVASNLQVQYVGATRVAGTVDGDTTSYNVVVNPGFGICAGCLKLQENFYGLTMDVSNTSNPRIDTVVLRLNDNDAVRSCDFHIVQGTPAAVPVAPTLTRNSSVWEIGLANLFKPTTVSTANPITVTDTRLDPTRCGVISSISEFDTSAMYDQVQDAMEHYQNVTEAEFEAWFNEMRNQLSTDAAGNLQNQIGSLIDLVTKDKTSLVGAINEAVSGGSVREDIEVHVSITGSDTTGDGSESNPYATITKALSMIPKNLNGFECTIGIMGGTYAETVSIRGFVGGTVTLTGTTGTTVNIAGLDIRDSSVLVNEIHLGVGSGGIYVGGRALLYAATGTVAVTGAAEAVILRYGAVVEITTTLTINNSSGRALQAQYASTVSITNLAGSGNNIGVYAYHSTVFVRSMTLTAATQTINENSVINIGGAVG